MHRDVLRENGEFAVRISFYISFPVTRCEVVGMQGKLNMGENGSLQNTRYIYIYIRTYALLVFSRGGADGRFLQRGVKWCTAIVKMLNRAIIKSRFTG